jgi:hypothetical protein
MTQPWTRTDPPGLADAGAQVAQLRHMLDIVAAMAGKPSTTRELALDEAARISAAYAAALPIDQKRFDRAASRATAAATAGAEALIDLEERGRPTAPAAARLAEELGRSLAALREALSA